ncbi:helix-turn-helix domain-containing protein [Robertkochia sediminum]|uniref:helix-turn-helix domain-containing protein n=1 Tax=Robertkochia sediminum TaxID=2785326 RepID=UPI00193136C3|nr:helix-turn-helix domain-containing protein [Robertkochia sediminum]MBL7472253.1 helix-turn-helix domain-containing protein [Robertkochia sediminum]
MEPGSRESKDEKFLLKLEQLIKDHLDDENFGVQELAEEAGYSRSQLYRRVKLLVGVSTSVFIRRVRLHEALEMLKHDEATTSEIAYRVGFNSPSYFHRCFQKYYGTTPGAYKESVHQPKDFKYTLSHESNGRDAAGSHGSPNKNFKKIGVIAITILSICAIAFFAYYFPKTPSAAEPETIAVLPFAYLSAQNDTRFFADGMADNLILKLSDLDDLQVVSRTTSENYRDRGGRSVRQIADALNADYLIEGSVQCLGDRVRIHIKIIHGGTDSPVWSEMYDRNMTDQFAVQSEITSHVTSQVRLMFEKNDSDIHDSPLKDS